MSSSTLFSFAMLVVLTAAPLSRPECVTCSCEARIQVRKNVIWICVITLRSFRLLILSFLSYVMSGVRGLGFVDTFLLGIGKHV